MSRITLSRWINSSFFLSRIFSLPMGIVRTPQDLSLYHFRRFRTAKYHGLPYYTSSPRFACPKFFAVSLARSGRPGAERSGEERSRAEKKVYRKMAARIYVIRGRRLFPSFLHLLYTTAAAASATRWVVQRRGAGTTQLPRKLLHNKTACTFSYSQLSSAHPIPVPTTQP